MASFASAPSVCAVGKSGKLTSDRPSSSRLKTAGYAKVNICSPFTGHGVQSPGRGTSPEEVPCPVPSLGLSGYRSEEHTSELQSLTNLVCRLLLEKKKQLHYNGITRQNAVERIFLVRHCCNP